MDKTYEFTGETKNYEGHTLHRIRRTSDGVLGGWIEKEGNLEQYSNCWVADDAIVCDDALVGQNAQVYGNAVVYGHARLHGSGKVYGNAKVYGQASVYGIGEVYGDAEIYGNANVSGRAKVYESAKVYGKAHISDSAEVCGNARVCGDYSSVYGKAKVYGNATVCGVANVYDNAQVYGNAVIGDYAKIRGNAKVYGDAKVSDRAKVYGDAEVNSGIITGKTALGSNNENLNDVDEQIKDFIYKVENSNKLKVQTNYESIDSFFADDSDEACLEDASLCILTVDTKMTLIKLEKAKVDGKKCYKFIVDLNDGHGDDFTVRSAINSKAKFIQVLQYVKDSLSNYPQFVAYADELDNCM